MSVGLRMTSPGARMSSNPMGHPGPGPPMPPNAYRPQVMSPSINPSGARMYITNSPGVDRHSLIFIFTFGHISRLDTLQDHLFHMEYVLIS